MVNNVVAQRRTPLRALANDSLSPMNSRICFTATFFPCLFDHAEKTSQEPPNFETYACLSTIWPSRLRCESPERMLSKRSIYSEDAINEDELRARPWKQLEQVGLPARPPGRKCAVLGRGQPCLDIRGRARAVLCLWRSSLLCATRGSWHWHWHAPQTLNLNSIDDDDDDKPNLFQSFDDLNSKMVETSLTKFFFLLKKPLRCRSDGNVRRMRHLRLLQWAGDRKKHSCTLPPHCNYSCSIFIHIFIPLCRRNLVEGEGSFVYFSTTRMPIHNQPSISILLPSAKEKKTPSKSKPGPSEDEPLSVQDDVHTAIFRPPRPSTIVGAHCSDNPTTASQSRSPSLSPNPNQQHGLS